MIKEEEFHISEIFFRILKNGEYKKKIIINLKKFSIDMSVVYYYSRLNHL